MPILTGNVAGQKFFFKVIVGGTPTLVVAGAARMGLVLINEGPGPLRLGVTGSVGTNGILVPSGTYFTDQLSGDAWWAVSTTSSGTITGYTVEA